MCSLLQVWHRKTFGRANDIHPWLKRSLRLEPLQLAKIRIPAAAVMPVAPRRPIMFPISTIPVTLRLCPQAYDILCFIIPSYVKPLKIDLPVCLQDLGRQIGSARLLGTQKVSHINYHTTRAGDCSLSYLAWKRAKVYF